jgi:cellulose biosynthesis protein BcsQ
LNVLTVNALTAADGVLVPLQAEYFALEGFAQLVATINAVKVNLNHHARNPRRRAHHVRQAHHALASKWRKR